MAISKIIYKTSPQDTGTVWMDATPATASASDITSPKTAMLADGVLTTGTGSGGGGGGLEYEEGTWTPSEDVAKPTISFSNTHTEPPMFAMMIDASTTPTMDTYTQYSFIYTDWYRFAGVGFPYSNTSDLRFAFYRADYRAASATNSASLFTHNSDEVDTISTYPRYYVTNTEFKPSPGASTDRYWRAGRTYKWIAVWAPSV